MERWSFFEDRFGANAPANWNRPVKSRFEQQGPATADEPNCRFAQNALPAKTASANQKMTSAIRATVNPARVLFVEVTMSPTLRSTNLTFVEIRIVASPASNCIHLGVVYDSHLRHGAEIEPFSTGSRIAP